MMVRRLTAAAAGAVLVLAGCSAEPETEPAGTGAAASSEAAAAGVEARLAAYDLDGAPADEIVDGLDRLAVAERPADLMASVRVDQLVVSDGQEEVAMDLPEDRFYLSVAPFVDQTHECFYHSLTTCTGELGGEDVEVRIVDDAGKVLVDEKTTTYDNGFVGYWLPRDIDGTLTVSYDGRIGEVDFSTREDSPTCVTTLQVV
ncbi:CueP family metal-binding protein [Georgenia sp. SUBG003]|uniref:CueP family metal-binding protein n=1 Tax=Georgenia sp. SUBG003 TaxID=1497974 RepID=UPI003AB2332D